MKKLMMIVTTVFLLFNLCSTSVLAISESEVQSQVAAQGKEAVTGNILIWFLCAVVFLKVSQKIDTFLSSLGISISIFSFSYCPPVNENQSNFSREGKYFLHISSTSFVVMPTILYSAG